VSTIFVTGTGTDVGKTFVTAAIIRRLRADGRAVTALKPVMSGFDANASEISDAGVILDALGRPVAAEEIEKISPWRFAAPLSPDLAAAREGRGIDFKALVKFCESTAAAALDIVLIEGVGGIMVPLDERHTVLDWMTALRAPVLLVTGSYLGTISHTLTALQVLAQRRLDVAAVVVNESPTPGASVDETVGEIARFSDSIDVIGLPRRAADAHTHAAVRQIADLF
jgi:dethiobiotin synthetase